MSNGTGPIRITPTRTDDIQLGLMCAGAGAVFGGLLFTLVRGVAAGTVQTANKLLENYELVPKSGGA